MSRKETIEKAYANVPSEPTVIFNFDWVPTPRGIKFYWIKLIRYITR